MKSPKHPYSDKTQNKISFSKVFWGLITLFIVISLVLAVFLLATTPTQPSKNKEPILQPETITSIFRIQENLIQNQPEILQNLLQNKELLATSINLKTDKFFDELLEKNLENFLDFHYSVKGEYLELWYLTADRFTQDEASKLQEKVIAQLLGEDFETQLNLLLDELGLDMASALRNHLDFINSQATQDLEPELNTDLFAQLKTKVKDDVQVNLLEKKSILIAGALGVKIAASLATKIAAKIAIKTTGKALAKGGAKGAAAATGATSGGLAGLACGPGTVICTPLLATLGAISAWFLADAAIISLEEIYSREEFKKEIQLALEEAKADLQAQLQSLITNLEEVSQDYQNDIKNLEVTEKRRILENIK